MVAASFLFSVSEMFNMQYEHSQAISTYYTTNVKSLHYKLHAVEYASQNSRGLCGIKDTG